jgi:hypothetical protein
VLLCAVFLTLWGDDSIFVYSQHWLAPLLVILAGVGLVRRRARHAANLALALLVVVTLVRSGRAWLQIFEALRTVS